MDNILRKCWEFPQRFFIDSVSDHRDRIWIAKLLYKRDPESQGHVTQSSQLPGRHLRHMSWADMGLTRPMEIMSSLHRAGVHRDVTILQDREISLEYYVNMCRVMCKYLYIYICNV